MLQARARIIRYESNVLKVVDAPLDSAELQGIDSVERVFGVGCVPEESYTVTFTEDPVGEYLAYARSGVAGCIVNRFGEEPRGGVVICFMEPHEWVGKRFNRRVTR